MRLKSLLPYLKKHIPGQPNLVPEYLPGGGGRKAANYIYRTARADGLTLGFPPGGFIMFAVLGETGVNYDLDKFTFFGSPESNDHYVFLTRGEANLNSIEKLQSADGVRVGGHSVGHTILWDECLPSSCGCESQNSSPASRDRSYTQPSSGVKWTPG